MKRYHLTQKDRDLLGRTIRTVQGMGRGERPLPRRRRNVEGSGTGGEGKRTTIVRATAAISAGSGDPRTPGTSTDYEHIKGDTITGNIENWSEVEISDNSYMVILEIEGDNVIVSAFC